ncbi:HsdM family class I SAM-dependent methyltransferase [Paractinoplanes brasiliensis]|uniref:N-6 DNA methylase n=1 Tax=Paractinoplanes brasiliensis TaxID=52695 RepID=A0A4R6K267_9ACTN|nr:N-6 DNA methylase [Actinoplanes brasiliensis]TDO41235.1 N-6 DNA methylase [Actinoplanes brasiliensis]GID27481.1 type II restriction endonuclease subunit M [Actinoplanes brasiliensis]
MTELRGPTADGPTLTASGIARLADVGRPAVSNWRRRYADFPSPVGGTPGNPQFDAEAIEQWLRRQGKLHQASPEQLVWRYIENYRPAVQLEDALVACGAYLLVSSNPPDERRDTLLTAKQVLARLRALDRDLAKQVGVVLPERWTSQLATLLQAVHELSREQKPEDIFEYLHNQYVTSAQSLSGLANTPDRVAGLMLALAGPGAVTFDFTCGTGSILRLAADQAIRDGVSIRCCGQEIKPQYALIALLRLSFVYQRARDSGQSMDPPAVHIGDSLLADGFPHLKADVVVANFPFGIHDWGHDQLAYDPRWVHGLPPRTEPELAWVQHALAHLRIGGTAAVLMPPAAALRPAGRRIRAELVRTGTLRAVVALPPGSMPPAGISLHIWVLTQPDPQQEISDRLLFVDATASSPNDPLTGPVIEAWNDYLSGQDAKESDGHRIVPALQVLEGQVDLTPWKYVSQTGRPVGDPAQTLAKVKAFEKLLEQTRGRLPALQAAKSTTLALAPQATVADLIRSGGIVVQQRTGTRNRSLREAGPSSTTPVSGQAGAAPIIRGGDIVVPTTGHVVVASVATPEQIGQELEPGHQLVRIDREQFDPWFMAGVLSRTENAGFAGRSSSAGSGARRIDVKRFTIPVLPLDQQREYGRTFRQLAEFRAALREVATTGEALTTEISDGLARGSLTGKPQR